MSNLNPTLQIIIKGCSVILRKVDFSMDESRAADIPQVSAQENTLLTAPYSEDEVNNVNFQMEHHKAPGPDGFLAEFYQTFWDTIKSDLLELFGVLYAG
jgi:hypothetical protein